MLIPVGVFAISGVCDAESSRYVLGAVQFSAQNGKSRAVATDGRVLIVAEWSDEDGDLRPVLVPCETCEAAYKLWKRSRGSLSRLSAELHTITLANQSSEHVASLTAREKEGRFPDVGASIFGTAEESLTVQLDLRCLAKTVAALDKMLPSNEPVVMRLTVPQSGARAILSLDTPTLRAAAVVMPRAADAETLSKIATDGPAWLPTNTDCPQDAVETEAVEPP